MFLFGFFTRTIRIPTTGLSESICREVSFIIKMSVNGTRLFVSTTADINIIEGFYEQIMDTLELFVTREKCDIHSDTFLAR